jgi:hypothetical protein
MAYVKASYLDHKALFGYFLGQQKVTISQIKKAITCVTAFSI